jgi:hypothetical protein
MPVGKVIGRWNRDPWEQGPPMSREERPTFGVRVVAIDPPFEPGHEIMFGLQDKKGDVEAEPACRTTEFDTEIELIDGPRAGGGLDFRGRHVHGKKGDRFLYVSWGAGDRAQPLAMFARAKIKLADIPTDLLDDASSGETSLECRLEATNAKGEPASGTIKPPAVSWRSTT